MKELFEEWLENPATEVFMKYLHDRALEEAEILAESIYNGSIVNDLEQVRIATVCLTLRQIEEIDYTEIEEFYLEPSSSDLH